MSSFEDFALKSMLDSTPISCSLNIPNIFDTSRPITLSTTLLDSISNSALLLPNLQNMEVKIQPMHNQQLENKNKSLYELQKENETLKIENTKLKKQNSDLLSIIDEKLYSHDNQILFLKASWSRFSRFEPLWKIIEENVEKNGGTV
jgi:regulator of replication initiation timing